MEAESNSGQPAPPEPSLAALALRVAELERAVAELREAGNPVPAITPRPRPQARPPRPQAPPPLPQLPQRAEIPPAPASAPPRPPNSLEDRLGSQIFNIIGAVAVILGMALFLKLAIEHGYIGPGTRVLIGLAAGTGLILWSERFRRRRFAVFSYSLKAVGSGILYLSLWAAFHLYHLLPSSAALALMLLVTAWNAFMAWSQDAELLAGYALAGGFLTPLLLSTGGNHETFLFTYIAALDLATVVLVRSKPWHRLLTPAFFASVAFFIGWYSAWFHLSGKSGWNSESSETASFTLVFFALFALPSLRGWATRTPAPAASVNEASAEPSGQPRAQEILSDALLPLLNAAFVSLALYSVFEDSGLHADLPWLMVALSALALGLMRLQRTTLGAAMQLAAAVVFLTVAIPLKASGHSLTTAWLAEGLVLYWASTRFEAAQRRSSAVLRVLSAAGYVLGLGSLLVHWGFNTFFVSRSQGFFNRDLGAALVAVAALAGAAWLSSQPDSGSLPDAQSRASVGTLALIALNGVALLLTARELLSRSGALPHPAFRNADFATALVGLAVLAGAAWAGYRLSRHVGGQALWTSLAGMTAILFNLVALLTVEREIGALWTRAEANLQRSLAISGFLMAYGALLLAVGFSRRSAFVRWQALALLLFTICKVFLYDFSSLSAGYRVSSFLALGALLMTVSFAYQRDWLGLKEAPQPSEASR